MTAVTETTAPAASTGVPASATGPMAVLAGIVALPLGELAARAIQGGPTSDLALRLAVPALAMVAVELLVYRVHRRPSVGLAARPCRSVAESWPRVVRKFAVHALAWGLIALYYATFKEFRPLRIAPVLDVMVGVLVICLVIGPLYILWVDRRQLEPDDTTWLAWRFLAGHDTAEAREAARILYGSYALRAFFLPFVASSIAGLHDAAARLSLEAALAQPQLAYYVVTDWFWIADCTIASIGYLAQLRILDGHVRSVYRHASSWIVALVCYPPYHAIFFTPSDHYQPGLHWDSIIPVDSALGLMWMVALALVWSVNIWANCSFGLRFSNLCNRGIVTGGPYRFCRHPAYLTKNIAWWLMYLPFVPLNGPVEALRACALMLFLNLVYFLRAKSEERELEYDPDYSAYCRYLAEHGLAARVSCALGRRRE